MSLTVIRTPRPDLITIYPEGQLTVGNRQELKDRVVQSLERGERDILVDFSQTTYIDGSGLGVLVSIQKRVRDAGGRFAIRGLSEEQKTLFELTRLDTLFDVERAGPLSNPVSAPSPSANAGAAGNRASAPSDQSMPADYDDYRLSQEISGRATRDLAEQLKRGF